ncbi:MAG: hypothetical protein IPH96_17670 [Saprospiraceae bacterium]|nr:hypothetical protein [Saprospiraceae bacterium]
MSHLPNPTTGAAGYYTFDNLIAGTYKIMVMYPTGYTGTGKSTLDLLQP